jgi:cytochrome c553
MMPSMSFARVRLAGTAPAFVLALVLGIVMGAAGTARAAGDAQRGKLLGYTCLGCHGVENYKNAYPTYSVPRLVGQHPDYLVAALKAYRTRERSHGTMYAQAASLSDQDMADIAAYFAGPAALEASAPATGTAPAKVAQLCSSCHGANGVGITGDFPTLSGQHADYLERALDEYRKGGRKNPIMAGFAAQLNDADLKEIARYYAQQQPKLRALIRPAFLL